MCHRSNVWNERTVYRVRSRNGVCLMPSINTLLERNGVYRVSERPVLERNGVYRVRKYMLGRDIRIDGVYANY